eukprot:3408052-Pyramimonas_sp.AAC.1
MTEESAPAPAEGKMGFLGRMGEKTTHALVRVCARSLRVVLVPAVDSNCKPLSPLHIFVVL